MNKNLIVKKPDEMIEMRGNFSESALKLSAYLISFLKENEVNYKIKVKDYLKKFDKKIKDFEYLYHVARELNQKQFKMIDRIHKKFSVWNFVSNVDYSNGILEVEFSFKTLNYLLNIKEKYLKYNIKNIMSLNSKYTIRLYEILKNKYEKTKSFQKVIYLEKEIEELREELGIPLTYKYFLLKKRILEKAKSEFQEHTDIFFDYEEIKTGRKVTAIKFIIHKNSNYKESTSINQKEYKEKILSIKKDQNSDNWNNWRKELLNKGNLIINFNDEIFEVKNNYLFKDKKLLSSEKSFEIWQELYENRDKLKIMSEDEYIQEQIKKAQEQENKYKKIDELKEKYNYLIVKINGEHKEVVLSDIQLEDNIYKLYMSILWENKSVCQNFKSLEKLEEFLEVCYDAYLRNKGKI